MGMAGVEELAALEDRVAELESQQLLQVQRTDPVLALATSLHDLGEVPACHIYNSGTDSIGDASWEKVAYDSVRWATDIEMADLTNNRILINESGLYLLIAQIKWAPEQDQAEMRGVQIINANSDVIAETVAESLTLDTALHGMTCSTVWKCDAVGVDNTTYFEVRAYQNSGAAKNIVASTGAVQQGNNFMVIKLANFGEL